MVYVARFCLIALYTVFWGVLATFVAPFSGEAIVWIARRWIGWIFRTCGIRVQAEGLEHVAATQAAVYMSNHQSVIDIGAIALSLPVSWRFVAKKELTYIPFFGWALALSDQIVIDRGNRRRSVESLRRAAERVRGGVNVIIFPEGTRSPDGRLQPFKSGGFHLALDAQVPVIPVTVSGSWQLIPKRSLRVRSGPVKVVYGKPIETAGMTARDREALKRRVADAIRAGYDVALQPPR
jgi:1-acyl-sn-glycerol-3-phosphate acyltransferase